MAQSGILTNIDAVKNAINLYKEVSRKDADVAFRSKMADIAFRASENTIYATKEAIRAEISNLPITKDGGKKRYGNSQYVGQYKLINWERKLKGLPALGGSKYRFKNLSKPNSMVYEEKRVRNKSRLAGLGTNLFMDGKYKSFIQSRVRSAKFIRAAWGVAAEFFGKPFSRGDFGPAARARFSGLQYGGASVKPISPNITEYAMFNGAGRYDTRRKRPGSRTAPERSSQDQEKAAKIIEAGLDKGISEVLADITKYFETRQKRVLAAIRVLNKLK